MQPVLVYSSAVLMYTMSYSDSSGTNTSLVQIRAGCETKCKSGTVPEVPGHLEGMQIQ